MGCDAFPGKGSRSGGAGSSGRIWRPGAGQPPAPGCSAALIATQPAASGLPLTGFMGVVGRLGQGHAERPCIDRDLDDKPLTAHPTASSSNPGGLLGKTLRRL